MMVSEAIVLDNLRNRNVPLWFSILGQLSSTIFPLHVALLVSV